jgi:hypothetical protein
MSSLTNGIFSENIGIAPATFIQPLQILPVKYPFEQLIN